MIFHINAKFANALKIDSPELFAISHVQKVEACLNLFDDCMHDKHLLHETD